MENEKVIPVETLSKFIEWAAQFSDGQYLTTSRDTLIVKPTINFTKSEVRKPRQRERARDCYSLKCEHIFGIYYKIRVIREIRDAEECFSESEVQICKVNNPRHPR